ncbi:MAG: response regulator transcription factor [Chloroflexi bacterium]|nr:response regulator transcription factor [Chloroflexota bacterium]
MIRLLIADDHAMFRSGIRLLLEIQDDFEVVGEAEDGEAAVALAVDRQPDVVLLDIGLPGLDGIAACERMRALAPRCRVILLTQHENREYVVPGLKAGAAGYVLKRAAADELIGAIRAVHAGQAFLDPTVTQVMLDQLNSSTSSGVDGLSEREREVLTLMARGQTYREIGSVLGVSPKTVDFHRANVMQKLGLRTRAELVQFAVRHGLVE